MVIRRKQLVHAPIASLRRLAVWLGCEGVPPAVEDARSRIIELVERRLRFHGHYSPW